MSVQDLTREQYDHFYSEKTYYWTTSPSAMCLEVLKRCPPVKPLKVLDIGCGEGRNAVFFARNGYEVHAFDISPNGVEKTRQLARMAAVDVHVFQADLNEFRIFEDFDILFSTGVLHCLHPEARNSIFENYRLKTNEGGIHAFSAFVKKPFIAQAPDADPNGHDWHSGELMSRYGEWLIEWSLEEIFDCSSSGVPHKHAVNRLIAKKPHS